MVARTGHLEVVVGPMFAGKTELLMSRMRSAEGIGLRCAVVRPSIDTRNPPGEIISHGGSRISAVVVGNDGSDLPSDVDHLGIDETQFLSNDAIPRIVELVRGGMHVLACGLDLTSRGEPFGPMPALMALADDVVKLRAWCARCGASASRSQRLVPVVGNVWVGGKESYEPRCTSCFDPAVAHSNTSSSGARKSSKE